MEVEQKYLNFAGMASLEQEKSFGLFIYLFIFLTGI